MGIKKFMKKQVVVIHGGDTFERYEEFLSFLKNFQIDPDYFKKKGWKDTLQYNLGDDFEVIAPNMPNKINAKYLEWKIWFEKYFPFLNDGVILVGHSLGGTFLTKYLSENLLPKKIKALILVAASFDDENSEESLNDFVLPTSLAKITKLADKIYLFHSKDDPVVPFEQVNKYKTALPNAEIIVFADRQHFNQEYFPELVELLKK